MSRIAYVNGRYVPHRQAAVSIDDRGFQFADAVYEYFAVFGGKLADAAGHFGAAHRTAHGRGRAYRGDPPDHPPEPGA